MFSFNNPYGACPTCTGLGSQLKVDPELIIPNKDLSILEGAITASGWNNIKGDSISRMYFEALAKQVRLPAHHPGEGPVPGGPWTSSSTAPGGKAQAHLSTGPTDKGTFSQAFEGICTTTWSGGITETQSDACAGRSWRNA
ncbi:MAG: hypothetical protein ACLT9P_02355 [Evtepia gabavorous]